MSPPEPHRVRRAWLLVGCFTLLVAGSASVATASAPPPGTRLWARAATIDRDAVAVAPNGARVYVTGEKNLTVAYDAATGATVWSRSGGGEEGCPAYYDRAVAVTVAPDGSMVFVTGSASRWGPGDYGCGSVWWTVAYDAATGATRWQREWGPYGAEDSAVALAVSPDGRGVFVTGSGGGCMVAVAYEARTGEERWETSGCVPGDAVTVGPNSARVFVTGSAWDGPGSDDLDLTTMALDAMTGDASWSASYDGLHGWDAGASVAVAPNAGRLFVTGVSAGADLLDDYVTVAYDPATGRRQWVSRYDGGPQRSAIARSVKVSPDGRRVFVTGESGVPGETANFATIAYDAVTGARRWVARYDVQRYGPDRATALAVDPTGSAVYVSGGSWRDGRYETATLAYDPVTGARRWTARYRPGGGATALAVGPSGSRVFVAGSGATIAYAA